jgi:hypothetical protein
MIGNTMKKAILIPMIVLGLMSSAKADVLSCIQANEYEKLAAKQIDFADKLRILGQPFQDEKNAAIGWMVKQNQAEAKCSAADREYYEKIYKGQ